MLHLLLLALLSSTPESREAAERVYYARLQAQQARIFMIWRPNRKLIRDEGRAFRCYARFHLGKTPSCDAELGLVDDELKATAPDLPEIR